MQGIFEIPAGEAEKERLFTKARREADKEGIKITGDTKQGRFSGRTVLGTIEGTYVTDKDKLMVSVTKKPMIVPNTVLRMILQKVFAT